MSHDPTRDGDDADPMPRLLIDAIERLRRAINRIPGGIAARIRPAADGASGIAGPGSRAAELVANLRPVLAGVAADFGERIRAGFRGIDAGFRNATSRAARNFERAFDATAGRVINGVGSGLNGIGRGAKATWADPRAAFRRAAASASNAFGRAQFGGSVLGAFAMKRARRAFGGARRAFSGFGRAAVKLGKGGVAAALKRTRLGATGAVAAIRAGGGIGRAVGAFAAGASGVAGAVGPAMNFLVKANQAINDFAERTNDSNRYLAPYSGRISAAFGRLDMGEERRNLQMARGTEGSAEALADSVNNLRDSTQGMSRLWASIKNRLGREGAELITPLNRTLSGIADQYADWMEQKTPDGKPPKTWTHQVREKASEYLGWAGSFLWTNPGDYEAASKAANEARETFERMQAAGAPMPVDGWVEFMNGAMNLPPLNPPRKFAP